MVFTKADLVIKEDLEKKIEQAKITLSNLNKKIFGVIAYDSFNKEIVVGDNELNDFMELANGSGHSQEDIRYQLSSLNEIGSLKIILTFGTALRKAEEKWINVRRCLKAPQMWNIFLPFWMNIQKAMRRYKS